MKTWILKFIAAMGLTAVLLFVLGIIYSLLTNISGDSMDRAEFGIIVGAMAIYMHFRDYVDEKWNP